jgi:predicted permease
MSGRWSPGRALQTPVVYAALLALAFVLLRWQPPAWLVNTTMLVGSLAIPLLLMALGVSHASLRTTRLLRTAGPVVLRLVGGTAVGFTIAWVLGLDGVLRGVVVLMSGMPPAVFNYMFALQFGRDPDDVASLVVASTLASVAMLPAALWLLLG